MHLQEENASTLLKVEATADPMYRATVDAELPRAQSTCVVPVRANCTSYNTWSIGIPSTAAPSTQVLVTVMAVMPYSNHVK